MYSLEEYENLKTKYGSYASWAIWDENDQKDTSVIDRYFDQLSPRYVFVGLNISAPLRDASWSNFHAGRHDRKLKYACNDTVLRGSFLTDLFKGIPEAKSFRVNGMLTNDIIKENVSFFEQEMRDIKLKTESTLVILGGMASRYFDDYFKHLFNNEVIKYRHYSSYGTDREWVEGLWNQLDIKQDFDPVIKRYH